MNRRHNSFSRFHAKTLRLFVLSAVLPTVVTVSVHFLIPHWRWENTRLFSVTDEIAGLLALALGAVFLLLRTHSMRESWLAWTAAGFFSLGILYEFKSFSENVSISLWLDTIAVLVTSTLFLLARLSFISRNERVAARLPTLVIFATLTIGVAVLSFSEMLPRPIVGNTWALFMVVSHLLTGTLFLLGAAYGLREYARNEAPVQALLASLGLLFSASYFCLPMAGLWELEWWLIQLYQFIPFILGLHFMVAKLRGNQQALVESEERFRRMFEESPIGIGLVGPDYTFTRANRALCHMLGRSEAELQTTNIKMFTHPDDIFHAFSVRNRLLRGDGQAYQCETRYLRKDGSMICASITAATVPYEKGRAPYELRLIEDITQEKIVTQKMKDLADELAISNRELDRFASIVAHDFKAPLSTIANFAQLLVQRVGPGADAEMIEQAHFITEATSRLHELVDDLLAYSRAEKGKIRVAQVDCMQLVGQVLGILRLDIERTGARITYEALPAIAGDRTQFFQVFLNLVSNSLKYRGSEPPCVRLSCSRRDDEWVFSVADNGLGFDMKDSEKVFHPFERLHAEEGASGSGLGLPICKTIIARHGGKLWVDSIPGVGSTFYFTVPVTARIPEQHQSSGARESA